MIRLANGYVYDVHQGAFSAADLVIEGNRISEIVGRGGQGNGRVIDVDGAHLLPGLIDCHVHLVMASDEGDAQGLLQKSYAEVVLSASAAARRTLLSGVTTVRDCGGWDYLEFGLRTAIRKGMTIGPRLFLAGRILSITTVGRESFPRMYEVADGIDAVMRGARRQIRRGADFVKLMATGSLLSVDGDDPQAVQYTVEELRAAMRVAHDAMKPVAVHAYAVQGIRNAVEAGVDSIEHGSYADEAVLTDMEKAGITLVPTCCNILCQLANPGTESHVAARLRDARHKHMAAMRRAYELKVPIAMGTDAGTPGNHHGDNAQECVAMVEHVGMQPVDSIRTATLDAAHLLRRADDLGSLEAGKLADIVAVRGNPLEDIGELTRVAFVMKDGEVIRDEI